MSTLAFLIILIVANSYLAFCRIGLKVFAVTNAAILVAYLSLGGGSVSVALLMLVLTAIGIVLNLVPIRQRFLSGPAFSIFKQVLPKMSTTEKEALEAGTTWWEGELFSGKPDWNKLAAYPKPALSDTEQAFIDGPVEELCGMLDDWTFCNEYAI